MLLVELTHLSLVPDHMDQIRHEQLCSQLTRAHQKKKHSNLYRETKAINLLACIGSIERS